jgi:hypothetical protein
MSAPAYWDLTTKHVSYAKLSSTNYGCKVILFQQDSYKLNWVYFLKFNETITEQNYQKIDKIMWISEEKECGLITTNL